MLARHPSNDISECTLASIPSIRPSDHDATPEIVKKNGEKMNFGSGLLSRYMEDLWNGLKVDLGKRELTLVFSVESWKKKPRAAT